jgi:hypothetical protein
MSAERIHKKKGKLTCSLHRVSSRFSLSLSLQFSMKRTKQLEDEEEAKKISTVFLFLFTLSLYLLPLSFTHKQTESTLPWNCARYVQCIYFRSHLCSASSFPNGKMAGTDGRERAGKKKAAT